MERKQLNGVLYIPFKNVIPSYIVYNHMDKHGHTLPYFNRCAQVHPIRAMQKMFLIYIWFLHNLLNEMFHKLGLFIPNIIIKCKYRK